MIHVAYSDEKLIVVGSDVCEKFITFGAFSSPSARRDVAAYFKEKLRQKFLTNLIEGAQILPDPEPKNSDRRRSVDIVPEEFRPTELAWAQINDIEENSITAHHFVDEADMHELWNIIADLRKS